MERKDINVDMQTGVCGYVAGMQTEVCGNAAREQTKVCFNLQLFADGDDDSPDEIPVAEEDPVEESDSEPAAGGATEGDGEQEGDGDYETVDAPPLGGVLLGQQGDSTVIADDPEEEFGGSEPATDSTPVTAPQEDDEEYETLDVMALDTVKLGRQGENDTQTVKIDCRDWGTAAGGDLAGCTLMIAALRPGESAVYMPVVSVENGVITWPILAQDTALAGWGRGEVRAMLNGRIKKSAIFRTRIEPSIEGDGSVNPPTPPDWAQAILDAVAAAQSAAESAAATAQAAADEAAAAAQQAAEAAANTAGLRGWSLTKENDDTVTIEYTEGT